MEDKLKEILEYQEGRLHEYETELANINSNIIFMSAHKFENELRHYQEKKLAILELFLDYKKSTYAIRELLNAWLS